MSWEIALSLAVFFTAPVTAAVIKLVPRRENGNGHNDDALTRLRQDFLEFRQEVRTEFRLVRNELEGLK